MAGYYGRKYSSKSGKDPKKYTDSEFQDAMSKYFTPSALRDPKLAQYMVTEMLDKDVHGMKYIRRNAPLTRTGKIRSGVKGQQRLPPSAKSGLSEFRAAWNKRKNDMLDRVKPATTYAAKKLIKQLYDEFRTEWKARKPQKVRKARSTKYTGFNLGNVVEGVDITDKKKARKDFMARHVGQLSESALRRRFNMLWDGHYRGQGIIAGKKARSVRRVRYV